MEVTRKAYRSLIHDVGADIAAPRKEDKVCFRFPELTWGHSYTKTLSASEELCSVLDFHTGLRVLALTWEEIYAPDKFEQTVQL